MKRVINNQNMKPQNNLYSTTVVLQQQWCETRIDMRYVKMNQHFQIAIAPPDRQTNH